MPEFDYDIERSAAHYDHIDGGKEFVEAVRFLLAGGQEVECVVGASQKTVDADSAKDGQLDGVPPESAASVVADGGESKESEGRPRSLRIFLERNDQQTLEANTCCGWANLE